MGGASKSVTCLVASPVLGREVAAEGVKLKSIEPFMSQGIASSESLIHPLPWIVQLPRVAWYEIQMHPEKVSAFHSPGSVLQEPALPRKDSMFRGGGRVDDHSLSIFVSW